MSDNTIVGDSPTTDIEEYQRRREAERKRKLEAVDFTTTPQEAESAKLSAEETPIQGKEAETDAEYDPEDASKDNYPMHEGREDD